MSKISQGTIYMVVPCYFFKSKFKVLEIQIVTIGTDNQLSDQFTK